MNMDEIRALMTHFEASKLHKMVYKKGDFELQLEKEGNVAPLVRKAFPAETVVDAPVVDPKGSSRKGEEAPGSFVTSPMVGTFYASPGPDQPHFVKMGDPVSEGAVICIIEAMKVMNEVKAGVKGIVAEILVHNGQPVEFGTRLFRIVPA